MALLNDRNRFEKPPKHSEADRYAILYFPNKFIDAAAQPASPRTYYKDLRIEDEVAGDDFRIGLRYYLMMIKDDDDGDVDDTALADDDDDEK